MSALTVAISVVGRIVIWRIGAFFIRTLSSPLSPPPPPGEMRKVNLRYRCAVCGSEVRMTSATTDLPEAPRHCMEEMDLVTPVD